eukprot:1478149-Pleurochrysis_carterae.AAC.2
MKESTIGRGGSERKNASEKERRETSGKLSCARGFQKNAARGEARGRGRDQCSKAEWCGREFELKLRSERVYRVHNDPCEGASHKMRVRSLRRADRQRQHRLRALPLPRDAPPA